MFFILTWTSSDALCTSESEHVPIESQNSVPSAKARRCKKSCIDFLATSFCCSSALHSSSRHLGGTTRHLLFSTSQLCQQHQFSQLHLLLYVFLSSNFSISHCCVVAIRTLHICPFAYARRKYWKFMPIPIFYLLKLFGIVEYLYSTCIRTFETSQKIYGILILEMKYAVTRCD